MRTPIIYLKAFVLLSLFISCSTDIKFPVGGYDYPATKSRSLKDSFNQAYYLPYWCTSYNETDLRIKSAGQNVFRLIYETAFGDETIFTMTQNEIVIKRAEQGNPYPVFDSLKLNGIERYHFQILQRDFPIQEFPATNRRKVKLDSLVKIYPQLLEPGYYKELLDKAIKKDTPSFKYSIKAVPISESTYRSIVNKINLSGYWNLPKHIKCTEDYADGFGFALEVNTATKYNFVTLSNCPEKAQAFSKACQAIIDAARLDKNIIISN